jgi:hypothetical protein
MRTSNRVGGIVGFHRLQNSNTFSQQYTNKMQDNMYTLFGSDIETGYLKTDLRLTETAWLRRKTCCEGYDVGEALSICPVDTSR